MVFYAKQNTFYYFGIYKFLLIRNIHESDYVTWAFKGPTSMNPIFSIDFPESDSSSEPYKQQMR